MKTKICSKCSEVKPANEFREDERYKNGLCNQCKKCKSENSRKWQKNNPEKEKERKKIWREKNIHRYWSLNTLHLHKKRGYQVKITTNELIKLAKNIKYCSICNIKLNWQYGSKKGKIQNNSPTLDRIKNNKILNKNNIQVICNKCNASKRDRTMDEFIQYCTKVSNKFNQI